MPPELFHIGSLIIYSYAFCIVVGTLVATMYIKRRAIKDLDVPLSNNFFYLIFIAGFIGGKVFFYLEKPIFYLKNSALMLDNFSGGFVFYGSFMGILVFVLWYFKKYKLPMLPMLDILAIGTVIAHVFGRMGCFLGGCCYGKPTDSVMGMPFPKTNGIHVHPSQLYEIIALLLILFILFNIKKSQQFKGQVFVIYIGLYAIARSFLEIFRGDNRGFIFKDVLSHAQFIGILLLISSVFFYSKIKNKQITLN